MRSRTSRGVLEWSGGEELYIGSQVSATGKVSGVTGIVPGPPEGSRGSTRWGHLSRRAPWAEVEREPAPGGLVRPPWASLAALLSFPLRLATSRGGPVTFGTPKLPETIPVFLYINLYLRTIPELLVTCVISYGTPNNFRVTAYSYLYNPSVTEP